MYQGTCHGGPLAGEVWESRFQKGFLLVDKPNNKAWLYDWDAESESFNVRDEEAMVLVKEKRLKAAEEFDYDVVAAPWGGVYDYTGA